MSTIISNLLAITYKPNPLFNSLRRGHSHSAHNALRIFCVSFSNFLTLLSFLFFSITTSDQNLTKNSSSSCTRTSPKRSNRTISITTDSEIGLAGCFEVLQDYLKKVCLLIVFNSNNFEMRLLNLRIDFLLMADFFSSSWCFFFFFFTTFRPNFTSGLLQVINRDLG